MLAFGLWWLGRVAAAHRNREGYAPAVSAALDKAVEDETVRQRATTAHEFDPREVHHGHPSREAPPIGLAALPLLVVVSVNVLMTLVILPRLDVPFLAKEEFVQRRYLADRPRDRSGIRLVRCLPDHTDQAYHLRVARENPQSRVRAQTLSARGGGSATPVPEIGGKGLREIDKPLRAGNIDFAVPRWRTSRPCCRSGSIRRVGTN